MSEIVEIRVRPVVRYLITRHRTGPEPGTGSLETLGEFDSAGYAEDVADILRQQYAQKEYIAVAHGIGESGALVQYAYTIGDANAAADALVQSSNMDARIFSRLMPPHPDQRYVPLAAAPAGCMPMNAVRGDLNGAVPI